MKSKIHILQYYPFEILSTNSSELLKMRDTLKSEVCKITKFASSWTSNKCNTDYSCCLQSKFSKDDRQNFKMTGCRTPFSLKSNTFFGTELIKCLPNIHCLQTLMMVQHKKHVNPSVYRLHIIGRQHARLSCSLDEPSHPSFINWCAVNNQVPIHKWNFIRILCVIVIHCFINSLEQKQLVACFTAQDHPRTNLLIAATYFVVKTEH